MEIINTHPENVSDLIVLIRGLTPRILQCLTLSGSVSSFCKTEITDLLLSCSTQCSLVVRHFEIQKGYKTDAIKFYMLFAMVLFNNKQLSQSKNLIHQRIGPQVPRYH